MVRNQKRDSSFEKEDPAQGAVRRIAHSLKSLDDPCDASIVMRLISRLGPDLSVDEFEALCRLIGQRDQSTIDAESTILKALEAAEELRTSRWTLYRMIETGQIPCRCWFKVGRAYRFNRKELLSWMASSNFRAEANIESSRRNRCR
ncbi:MAG: hypothetical protein AUK47_15675 [Deltaproteobacteria bacterium CG2_30_63_29]|nr:MAG: hypothetical protein AUK47_15675 [Deltaproteobacteria bacterium CG2_30_63_29]